MRRILPLTLLCAGASLSTQALAGNPCTIAGDSQLSFPGTNNPDVFGVTVDLNSSSGYGLSLCSPTNLDISWLTAYTFSDFNHDGFEDLMFGRTSNSGGEVQVFLNDKTGSGIVVLNAVLHTGAAAAPTAVDALDLNGDGLTDILTANGSDGTFTVMLNDGTGTFTSVKQYAAGSDVTVLAAADVNGDGHPDVVTESSKDQTVSVFLNNGDGTFAAPQTYPVGGPVATLSITDLNGDGRPDIYVSSLVEYGSAVLGPIVAADGSQKFLNNGDGTFAASAWQPISSGSSGSAGGSVTLSGGGVTVSVTSITGLFGSSGMQTPPITVASGTGKITFPAISTPATVTTSRGKSQPSGSKGSTGNASAGSGTTSGGGAMEWLSLAFMGLAWSRRRKRT